MNTEIALSSDALALGRPVDGLDTRDRKIIGSVVRVLQRLLESDGVTPALQEDPHAKILIKDGKVMLLAAISTRAMNDTSAESFEQETARPHPLPPLQTRQPRTFAFG